MNFTYSGGTAQQERWFQDALAQCSYPLDAIDASVLVVWGTPPPGADTRHPYMVTEVDGPSTYTVTIQPWADDYTNPNNQGLRSPKDDIYDFYKQGVVHELGHVVCFATMDPEDLGTSADVQTCCGMFWRSEVSSGTGRRLGTPHDWDDPSLSWADEIREAVAECFKCAFYGGRLIMMNRTNWNIDAVNWQAFLELLTPAPVPAVTPFYDDFSVDHLADYTQWPSNQLAVGGGELVLPHTALQSGFVREPSVFLFDNDGAFGFSEGTASLKIVQTPGEFTVSVGAAGNSTGTHSLLATYIETANRGRRVGPFFFSTESPDADSLTTGLLVCGSHYLIVPRPPRPFWLVAQIVNNLVVGELWDTDPALGGSPIATLPQSSFGSTGFEAPYLGIEIRMDGGVHSFGSDRCVAGNPPYTVPGGYTLGGQVWDLGFDCANTADMVVDDWRWGPPAVPGSRIALHAPYPFAPEFGSLASGPVARGSLAIGR